MSDSDIGAGSESAADPQPAPRASPGIAPGQTAPSPAATTSSSFDFNRPTIISLLYLSSMVLGVTGLVGLVLAYVWKGEPHAEWETSHYAYLIRSFWLGLIGFGVGLVLAIVLIGFVVWVAVGVLIVVRSVLSLVNAQKQQPMPNPDTWLA
jgi:uncharacterized membrane protein